MGKTKVKVKKVLMSEPGVDSPIIVRFEHGQLKPGIDLNDHMSACYYEGDVRATGENLKRNEAPRMKRKRVVVVQNEGMTYLGASDTPLNPDSELRTFIAIRKKKKLSIYEANPMTVSPYLGGYPHLQVKGKEVPKTPEERKTAAVNLIKAFGSKRKILSYERIEKHKINSDNMNESITTATESATVSQEQLVNKDESILTLAPPCNRETKEVRQVYLLKDILTKEDMEEMDELAEAWLNSSGEQMRAWRESKAFSDYFFEMWKRCSPKKNEPHAKYLAKLVLYTELLICFLKLKHYEIRKKNLGLPGEFPQWLVQKAMDNFTTVNATNIRCRSEAYKDKTCCYIMVLVLLANDFAFDVQLMSTSLQIHIKKLLTLAKAVGITITYNSTSKEYRGHLKLPLPKPVEKRGRARKMR